MVSISRVVAMIVVAVLSLGGVLYSRDPVVKHTSAPVVAPDLVPVVQRPVTSDTAEKVRLILITPTNRPFYLSRSIHHVLPLRECFDVKWFVVHRVEPGITSFAPSFRNHFSWITEVQSFNSNSSYGGHERNVARELVINSTVGDAVVYFLDDDNVLPNLCSMLDPSTLQLETLYYADQLQCGKMRLSTKHKDWSGWSNATLLLEEVLYKMDTGSFLIPLELLRRVRNIPWGLTRVSDAPFFSALISFWMGFRGSAFVQRLPSVNFYYNHLSERNGCLRSPWNASDLHQSLIEFRSVLEKLAELQVLTNVTGNGTKQAVAHEYGHILSCLRRAIPSKTAMYLEIGHEFSATSSLMVTLPETTNVIGIDEFHLSASTWQHNTSFPMKGKMHWIHSSTRDAMPVVKDLLSQIGPTIDILLFNGNNSAEAIIENFNLYAPLVSSGGFIVFDEFLDTEVPDGVRKAILMLSEARRISLSEYDVIGNVFNAASAGPFMAPELEARDWPRSVQKEFVLRKKVKNNFLVGTPNKRKHVWSRPFGPKR